MVIMDNMCMNHNSISLATLHITILKHRSVILHLQRWNGHDHPIVCSSYALLKTHNRMRLVSLQNRLFTGIPFSQLSLMVQKPPPVSKGSKPQLATHSSFEPNLKDHCRSWENDTMSCGTWRPKVNTTWSRTHSQWTESRTAWHLTIRGYQNQHQNLAA